MFAQLINVFKIRIGVLIAFTAMAGYAISPGASLPLWQVSLLGLLVLMASASAGAFNQFVERDIDARMARTRNRPFVSGALVADRYWLILISAILVVSVTLTAWLFNPWAAFHVFMGAFTYAVIYTIWLKRRSVYNIVIGGLAGSFAVLAGAAAVDPGLNAPAILLAGVLFLWTPSHFWSLAIALRDDYKAAGVPMLPVVVGDRAAAIVILVNTALLVLISVLPAFYGMGWLYFMAAALSGVYFIWKNIQLVHAPTRKNAMANFFASIIHLVLVLVFAIVDVQFVA